MPATLVPYTLAFSRLVIGLVFAWSSVGKLRDFPAFERAFANYQILPRSLVPLFARLVLSGEVVVVVLMLWDSHLLMTGFLLAILLLAGFSIVLLVTLARNLQTACHCFGSSGKPISTYDVLRNAGFLMNTIIGLIALTTPVDRQADLSIVEMMFLVLMAAVFVVFWVYLGDIADLVRTL